MPGASVHFIDPTHQDSPMAGIEPMDQFLVVRTLQEAVREAAREAVAQLLLVARCEGERPVFDGGVESAAVFLHHVRHVLGALHAALDLEAGDARGEQLGEQVVRREVAGREQVLELLVAARGLHPAVDHQVVRHPAALGALAAVRAALLQGFARQALPAPAHAQRSVHEALQLQVGAGGHGADLLDGELARQHHAGDPEGPGDLRRLRRRDRHLRRGVQR